MLRTVSPSLVSFAGLMISRPVCRSTPLAGIDRTERIGGQHLSAGAVDHVHIAVAVEVDQHLLHLARERHVEQDLLVDPVVVVLIVRGDTGSTSARRRLPDRARRFRRSICCRPGAAR